MLSTAMKSVGEVMAIGRSFAESLQKALRGLETGPVRARPRARARRRAPRARSRPRWRRPTPDRLLVAAEALRQGFTVERIHAITGFDPWFLERLAEIVAAEEQVRDEGLPHDAAGMRRLKAMGFSDKRLAQLALRSAHVERRAVARPRRGGSGIVHDALRGDDRRRHRGGGAQARGCKLGVRPVFKRIDSCAAEFDAATPYLYSTYEAPLFGEPEDEAEISDRRKIVILGGGPNRIGQGIEFDYCCCHACFALKEAGFETIMVNCNPETVSTDPDTSRPALFRAADRRGRAGDPPSRGGEGQAGRA